MLPPALQPRSPVALGSDGDDRQQGRVDECRSREDILFVVAGHHDYEIFRQSIQLAQVTRLGRTHPIDANEPEPSPVGQRVKSPLGVPGCGANGIVVGGGGDVRLIGPCVAQ